MEKVTTRTASIFMDEHGILNMVMLKGVTLDYEDATDNALVIKRLTGNKKTLKLIDAREGFGMDKKAREFVRSVDEKQTIARAVVGRSAINAIIVNFFIRLSKPAIPTQLFTDYDNALQWLLDFKSGKAGSMINHTI